MSELFEDSRYKKVKFSGTLDRTRNYITPTESGIKCPAFFERFIGWGASNERRAICEADDPKTLRCSYNKITSDGTSLCLRYVYGPMFEITDEIPEPWIQKKDQDGHYLWYDDDGNEVPFKTEEMVLVPLSDVKIIPYLEDSRRQDEDENKKPLYWDTTVFPEVKTTEEEGLDEDGNVVTFRPVWVFDHPHFFSRQYEDTHEKKYGHYDGILKWHHDV